MLRKTMLSLLTLVAPLSSQTNATLQTDAEKIADAMRGGPAYISKDATILDWPTTPAGIYRVLRKGTSEWTCLPTSAKHQPVCADHTFLKFFQDAVAHRPVHVERVGISYMYEGDTVVPQGVGGPSHPYHVEPHIMLVIPGGAGLENYTTDGSTGAIYTNRVPGEPIPYLVIPIHETPTNQ